MHFYVRRENFTTKSRFQNKKVARFYINESQDSTVEKNFAYKLTLVVKFAFLT